MKLVQNLYFCWNVFANLVFKSHAVFVHLGATAFCVAPNALFPFELYNEDYLERRDLYLTQCQQQLQQFIATYGPGTTIFSSDE